MPVVQKTAAIVGVLLYSENIFFFYKVCNDKDQRFFLTEPQK